MLPLAVRLSQFIAQLQRFVKQFFAPARAEQPLDLLWIQQQILDNSPYGMMLVDAKQPAQPILYVNHAFVKLTGFSSAEVLGRNSRFLQGTEHNQPGAVVMRAAIEHGEACSVVVRNYRKDGSAFWNEVQVVPICDPQGVLNYFVGMQKDVTVQEEALRALEHSERRYHQMFESNTAIKLVLDPETGSIKDANSAALKFYGYTREQLQRMRISDLNTLPETDIQEQMKRALTRERTYFEFRHRLASGEIRDVEVYSSPVDSPDGRRLYSVVVDVTGKRQAALEYQALFEQSNDAVFIIDLEGHHKRVNQRAANLFGYAVAELQDLSFRELIVSNEQNETHKIFARLLQGERIAPYERTFRHKDGTPIYTEINIELVHNSQGNPVHFQSVVRDITERKRLEVSLRESEERTRLALQGTFAGTWEWEIQTGHVVFDERWAEIIGYTLPELLPTTIQTWSDLAHPDDLDFSNQRLQAHFAGQTKQYRCEARMRHKAGHWVWVLDSGCVTEWTEDGRPKRMFGTHIDITESKQMEGALRESEAKYRLIAEHTSDAIYVVNAKQQILYVSPAQESMLGYSTDELLALTPESVAELNHPEDRSRIITHLRAAVAEQATTVSIERRLRHKDGHYIWSEDRATLNYSPTGDYLGAHIVSRNVSARKQAEQALELSETRYHAALESSMEAYYLLESVRDVRHEIIDFRIVQVNGNALREMRLPEGELVGSLICEHFPINRTNGFFERYKRVVETSEPLDEEYEVPPGYLASGWYRHQVTRVGDGVAIMNRNITERKQAEWALAQSEERLRTIADHIPIMISLYDQTGVIEYANPFWCDRLGWSLKEVQAIGDPLILFFPDVAERRQALEYMLSGLQGWRDFEVMTKHHGRLRTSWWNVPLSDGRSLGIGQDITERYQMEQALRESEEKFRAIAENMSDGIIIFDAASRPLYVSPSYDRQYGYTDGESLTRDPHRLTDVLHPEDREATVAALRNAICSHAETLTYSYRTRHKDGHYFWREDHARFKYGTDGTYLGTVVVARDITERKRMEEVEYRLRLEKDRLAMLTRFFQEAVHEFSTPLSTIGTGLYLLARSNDAERRALKAKQMEGEIDRINHLLQSLVLIMKVESVGSAEVASVDVSSAVRTECRVLEDRYRGQPSLQLDIQADLPLIMGYGHYLNQAFHELLENAYRFTPAEGTIRVNVQAVDDHILVEINDTGCGIAEADLPYVFDMFWRHDEAHTTPGFGLGLAIAKRIIEQHGGTISVSSEIGQGSCFKLTLLVQMTS
ncbi:PAS domain S-box protein [Candidatus Flexifilum breve]|uniref:PAS domain-containing protein n=1 Tax=Candidatus Flexifilum breve TaxID=3140694 RepID=UPI0031CCBFA1